MQPNISQLKMALSTPLILTLQDFSKDFIMESDASGNGIEAILSQKGRSITYYSEALKGSILHIFIYDKSNIGNCKGYLNVVTLHFRSAIHYPN